MASGWPPAGLNSETTRNGGTLRWYALQALAAGEPRVDLVPERHAILLVRLPAEVHRATLPAGGEVEQPRVGVAEDDPPCGQGLHLSPQDAGGLPGRAPLLAASVGHRALADALRRGHDGVPSLTDPVEHLPEVVREGVRLVHRVEVLRLVGHGSHHARPEAGQNSSV